MTRLPFAAIAVAAVLSACGGEDKRTGTPDASASDAGGLDLSGEITRVQTLALDTLSRGTTVPSMAKIRSPVLDAARKRLYFSATLSPYIGVVDTERDELVGAIDTKLRGYVSRQIAVNTESGILYFMYLESALLYRLDPVTQQRSAGLELRGGGAFSVDSSTGRVFAVAQSEIKVLDEALAQVGSIAGTFRDIKVVPETARLYALTTTSSIKVFDSASLLETDSLALPAGLAPRFLSVSGTKLYVTCEPLPKQQRGGVLVIVDQDSQATTQVAFEENLGPSQVVDGKVYLLSGYPYTAGCLPNEDGARGLVEVLDAVSGEHLSTIRGGLQGEGIAVAPESGTLYLANTGESTIQVMDLASGNVRKKIDTATTIEDIVVRPSDGALVVRNRLGGNELLLVKDGQVSAAPAPGNWPAKTLLDPKAGTVRSLSHYGSTVSGFALETLAPLPEVGLGEPPLRKDALSTMALDTQRGRAYAALPELGKVVAIDLASGAKMGETILTGFDKERADGPGLLQVAVNQTLGRVFVLVPQLGKILAFDGSLQPLSGVENASLPKTRGGAALDSLFSDDDAGRLYVGKAVCDMQLQCSGELPEGEKVVAIYPEGNRLYAVAVVKPASGPSHEQLVELERSTLTVTRRFDLQPIDTVGSTFGFDFQRGLAFAGYFETGHLDELRIGMPR
ncbi:MAG: YncE family protein [Deltaproteobacteria bacterium]|nr:YncE family protein [Deltaproteobacteria bacterium]